MLHKNRAPSDSKTRKAEKEMPKIGQKIVLFVEVGFQIGYLIVLIGQIRPVSDILKPIISHLMKNS